MGHYIKYSINFTFHILLYIAKLYRKCTVLYIQTTRLFTPLAKSDHVVQTYAFCSGLRSVTIHFQNYGPTSKTLKHNHMQCNDFWIESCFRVHSSKISK